MKKTFLLFFLVFGFTLAFGQYAQKSVRLPAKGKQIILDVQEATLAIEGYEGDDLLVESDETTAPAQKARPSGYKLLASGGGIDDDHLIHYEVLQNDDAALSVRLLSIYNKGLNFRHLKIKVPTKVHLKVIFVISELGAKMSFGNLRNELEVEGTAPFIEFANITGPLTLSEGNSGHRIGGTEKILISQLQIPKESSPASEEVPFLNIITTYGDVDISLPADAKTTVQADVRSGDLYSDLELVQQRPAFPVVKNRYTGNLNGGGKMIVINAAYGNVYLRAQK